MASSCAARLDGEREAQNLEERLLDFPTLRAQMSRHGWAAAKGTLDDVRFAAIMDGYSETAMTTRRKRTVLRPYEAEKAPPRSLSAIYGMGAQPLHTDGAHLPSPPDVVVLYSSAPTPTSTVVWSAVRSGRWTIPDPLRQGVFIVRGNGVSFLSSAYQDGRFRFDPGCMDPGDDYAREAVQFFEAARESAHTHRWEEPDQLLFIDNRTALHARDAITSDAETRNIERLAFRVEGNS